MRTFIATSFDNLKEFFVELQNQLTGNAKITFTKTFHLTYKFLGDVSDSKVKEIKSSLQKIKLEPFKVALNTLGVFPSENYIRVVWVGFEDNSKINELQKAIDNSLKDLFPKDKRFHPHITLGRVKFVKDKKAFIENLKRIKVEKKEFDILSFKLIKSTLTPQGPIYEDVAVFSADSKPL
jgi:2'-5' RNA ligase